MEKAAFGFIGSFDGWFCGGNCGQTDFFSLSNNKIIYLMYKDRHGL